MFYNRVTNRTTFTTILQLSIVTRLQRTIPKSRSEEIQLMRFTQGQPIEPGVIVWGLNTFLLIQIAVF